MITWPAPTQNYCRIWYWCSLVRKWFDLYDQTKLYENRNEKRIPVFFFLQKPICQGYEATFACKTFETFLKSNLRFTELRFQFWAVSHQHTWAMWTHTSELYRLRSGFWALNATLTPQTHSLKRERTWTKTFFVARSFQNPLKPLSMRASPCEGHLAEAGVLVGKPRLTWRSPRGGAHVVSRFLLFNPFPGLTAEANQFNSVCGHPDRIGTCFCGVLVHDYTKVHEPRPSVVARNVLPIRQQLFHNFVLSSALRRPVSFDKTTIARTWFQM